LETSRTPSTIIHVPPSALVRQMLMLNCLEYVEAWGLFLFVFLTEVTDAGKEKEEASKVDSGTWDRSVCTELHPYAWASLLTVSVPVT